jgi:heme/copper-type cytochrome/quinol oxidase subunit 1
MLPFLWNVFISLRNGEIAGDDPWEGNTLEWATSSPPPPYNFDRLPLIRSERPLFDLRHGRSRDHDDTVGPSVPPVVPGHDTLNLPDVAEGVQA